jgi:hypothetical protein
VGTRQHEDVPVLYPKRTQMILEPST